MNFTYELLRFSFKSINDGLDCKIDNKLNKVAGLVEEIFLSKKRNLEFISLAVMFTKRWRDQYGWIVSDLVALP